MNSIIRVFVVIFIFNCSFISLPLVVSSAEVSTQPNAISISDFLSSVVITEDGLFDINGLIQKLNLSSIVNTTSILSRLNVPTTPDGSLDLKSIFQNFNLTDVNLNDVLGSLNVTITDGVLDFTVLVQNINSSGGLTEYLNSLIKVNTSEDGNLDFNGLGKKYNMTVEEHDVTTSDGYILKVFHIPGDTSKVILLTHGLLCSSDDYILRGYTSLVYLLAQSGYDVWVMNFRGNRYSRNHQTLDPNTDDKFWEFSMQEYGYYDLSAVIDSVLEKTGQNKLSVVGHSEGTASVFVLTSTRTEYNDKIKIFVALSPVCFIKNSGSAMTTLLRMGLVLSDTLKAFGYQELMGFDSNVRNILQLLCSQGKLGYDLCYRAGLAGLSGYDPNNLELEFFISLLGHYPAGTSLKNFVHYGQIGDSDRFAQYDYGSQNNEIYGSDIPPNYDFQKVTCNVTLVGGKNDQVLSQQDFERVRDGLPNVRNAYMVDYETFDHFAFVYGLNAHEVFYTQLIEELNTYN